MLLFYHTYAYLSIAIQCFLVFATKTQDYRDTKKDLKAFLISMVGVLGLEPRTLRV